MKSLLQEAPSVERAISQAWEAAGRPQEFSVKIHDHGKRGFLGFSSSPAVVSITYKPLGASPATSAVKSKPAQARTSSSRDSRDGETREARAPREERSEPGLLGGERSDRRGRNDRNDRGDRGDRSDRDDRGRRDRRPERSDRFATRTDANGEAIKPRGLLSYVEPEGGEVKKDFISEVGRSTQDVFRKSSLMSESSSNDSSAGDVWDTAFVDSVIAWLKEIMTTMSYAVPFESRVSGKVLHVDFSEDFLNDSELSRSLYASLSFVLLQFLKREHKRRFRGLRIVLSHPGHDVSRIMLDS